ncbi:MAG: hypothetical protein V2A76_00335 [Planctomycetota bacterium]
MRRMHLIGLGTAVLLGAILLCFLWLENQRQTLYLDKVDYGSQMEQNLRFAEAALVYESALDLDLSDRERSEIRYRLARSKIRGNDLAGALGVLQELSSEDVARFSLDVGPLYLELGEKAMREGMLPLARIALQEGRGVSPTRHDDFSRRLDSMIKPADGTEESGGE